MITKKRIRLAYQLSRSSSDVEADKLVGKAIDYIQESQAKGWDINMTVKNIVDYAYDYQ